MPVLLILIAKGPGPGLLSRPSLVRFLSMTEHIIIIIAPHTKNFRRHINFFDFSKQLLCAVFFLCMHMLPKPKIKYSCGCPVRFYRQHYHKICFQKYTGKFILLEIFLFSLQSLFSGKI